MGIVCMGEGGGECRRPKVMCSVHVAWLGRRLPTDPPVRANDQCFVPQHPILRFSHTPKKKCGGVQGPEVVDGCCEMARCWLVECMN